MEFQPSIPFCTWFVTQKVSTPKPGSSLPTLYNHNVPFHWKTFIKFEFLNERRLLFPQPKHRKVWKTTPQAEYKSEINRIRMFGYSHVAHCWPALWDQEDVVCCQTPPWTWWIWPLLWYVHRPLPPRGWKSEVPGWPGCWSGTAMESERGPSCLPSECKKPW